MEWNLLMGTHSDRLGYTWLEFGRRDAEGVEHYTTLGCGLRAVAGRGSVDKWLFITTKRIGRDLFLQSSNRQPLTLDRLKSELGEEGQVFPTAAAYREAVDKALFQLDTLRYEALVNLLIKLRQPQLSRNLDEGKLSDALSEALPPLSNTVVADVAEAFRSLETDRNELDAFKQASEAVTSFLVEYRRYAGIAALRRAEAVVSAQSGYEQTTRKLKTAQRTSDQQTRVFDAAGKRIEELRTEERAQDTRVKTLENSPEMRDARHLDLAREDAELLKQQARQADTALAEAKMRLNEMKSRSEAVAQKVTEATDSVKRSTDIAATSATAAALDATHNVAVGALGLPDQDINPEALGRARQQTGDAIQRMRKVVRQLKQLVEAVGLAEAVLTHAKQRHADLNSEYDGAVEEQVQVRERLASEIVLLSEKYQSWTIAISELVATDPFTVKSSLDEWRDILVGRSPVSEAVQIAVTEANQRHTVRQFDIQLRDEQAKQRRADLNAERESLVSGHHQIPPIPYTRPVDAREGRDGGPLWKLCDFSPTVQDVDRVGLEAALEASGLLDAWITPEGNLLSSEDYDTVLVADSSPILRDEYHLGKLLHPELDPSDPRAASVDKGVISEVLRHIGVGQDNGHIWVATDGRWQLGPLRGSWTKPVAQYIGHGAREAERQRLLESLAAEIRTVDEELSELALEKEELQSRVSRAVEEAASAPADNAILELVGQNTAIDKAAELLRKRLVEAEAFVAQSRRAAEDATHERDRTAAVLDLTDKLLDLDEFVDAVHRYEVDVEALWHSVGSSVSTRLQAENTTRDVAAATDDEQQATERFSAARQRAVEAGAEHEVLEKTVGAAVQEVMRLLQDSRARLGEIRAEASRATEERVTTSKLLGAAETEVENHEKTLAHEDRNRNSAVASLRALASTGLLSVAHQSLSHVETNNEWSTAEATGYARDIGARLGDHEADDAARDKSVSVVTTRFIDFQQSLLRHSYSPYQDTVDGLIVVAVPFQGRDYSITELLEAFSEEITNRRTLLDEREREVLENHLIGEVSHHLHDLLRKGEELVAGMNKEIESRPTSTGMALRFAWSPVKDGPAGLAEARKRLLSVGGTWSPADRKALGDFLQGQIQAERASNEMGSWQEHLMSALDYRAWHKFIVERRQDGRWTPLTRWTHGTGSGGEKAIALTIPQFAAAAAHYTSASILAPRLILLDEAFAGIDNDMRSKCMGLLEAFDLDFVMTSEREWGCYPDLSGLAIYQLATRPGVEAVGITRWVWNGKERQSVANQLPPASSPGSMDAPYSERVEEEPPANRQRLW